MQIILNDKPMTLTEQDKPGVAVALNQAVVARSQWAEQILNENDNITLFHAIAGG